MHASVSSPRDDRRTSAARPLLIAAAVAATVLLLGVPGSAADTIGTPLGTGPFAGPPNNQYDCTRYDTRIGGVLPVVGTDGVGTASSCIWIDDPSTDPTAAFFPVQSYGRFTVTQVRVSVGPVTGSMAAVVMRALYENTSTPGRPTYACCTLAATSQPFMPQANAVTAVSVQLQMQDDPAPPPNDTSTIAVNDILALAVLEPGVPVPMYDLADSGTADFLWNTATPSTQTPSYYSDTSGFHVAMQADYTPAAGAAAGHISARAALVPGAQRASLFGGFPATAGLAGACPGPVVCIGGPWWVV
jgi:hypothetical protein